MQQHVGISSTDQQLGQFGVPHGQQQLQWDSVGGTCLSGQLQKQEQIPAGQMGQTDGGCWEESGR